MRVTQFLLVIPALLTLVDATQAMAQTVPDADLRPFCADRPGKGTPTCILDVGHWQVEVGLIDGARQSDDASKAESWAYGDTVLPLWPDADDRNPVRHHARGRRRRSPTARPATAKRSMASATSRSASAIRWPTRTARASSVALAGFVTAPTGSRDVRGDGFEGGVVLPVSVPLNDDWGLSLSPEIDVVADSDGDGRHAAYTMVAGVGRGYGQWALGGRNLGQPRRRSDRGHDPIDLRPDRRLDPAHRCRTPSSTSASTSALTTTARTWSSAWAWRGGSSSIDQERLARLDPGRLVRPRHRVKIRRRRGRVIDPFPQAGPPLITSIGSLPNTYSYGKSRHRS